MKRPWIAAGLSPRLRPQLSFRARARQLLAQYFEEPGARFLHTLKLTPNTVTLLGLVVTGIAAYLASQGTFLLAGLVFLLASILDMLDGALARLTDGGTRFGAVLDSVADRLSESLLLLGLVIFYLGDDYEAGVVLVFLVLVTSFMVSYVRARGEALGISMQGIGLVTRTERVIVLALGLITTLVTPALAIVLAMSAATAGQRMYHIWRHAGTNEPE